MRQKGFIGIIVLAVIVLLAGIGVYFGLRHSSLLSPNPSPAPQVCTAEAKQCPDGSYVSRTGPNCEFAACPNPGPKPTPSPIPPPSGALECTADSDCPSSQYTCEATQGVGTACPANNADPSCVPGYRIIAGVCKLKAGSQCGTNADCKAGLLCHSGVCTSPVGQQCSGPSDTSCPADYTCVAGCGPPVVSSDTPPPSYYCQLKGYERECPICLAYDTMIDTPVGPIAVQNMQNNMRVWTQDKTGRRTAAVIVKTSRVPVPPDHQMVRLILDDGRHLFVSPGHPTTDGRRVEELSPGDRYDGAKVLHADLVPYGQEATYDILPSGDTGFYWANGILVGSTLR